MLDPEVQWTTPAPLWPEVSDPSDASTRAFFRRPAILRFASDTFMAEFMTLLDSDPAQMKALQVPHETWYEPGSSPVVQPVEKSPTFARRLQRSRLAAFRAASTPQLAAPGARVLDAALTTAMASTQPLKLYQPGHQRYYLVTACLVCRLPGQPDRHIELGNQERASFVIRRVDPPGDKAITETTEDEWAEYAYVATPGGAGWQRVTNVRALATDEDRHIVEEQNPLFGVNFTQDDGRRRRLLSGLIPVGKREQYVGAPERDADGKVVLPTDANPLPDPRVVVLRTKVTEPWKAAIERSAATIKILTTPAAPPPSQSDKDSLRKATREQIQTTSWYVLLDFVDYLNTYLNDVWKVVTGERAEGTLTDPGQAALFANLKKINIRTVAHQRDLVEALVDTSPVYTASSVKTTLLEALKAIAADEVRRRLETANRSYDRTRPVDSAHPTQPDPTWPNFLFPLADPEFPDQAPQPPDGSPALKNGVWDLETALARIDDFVDLITDALKNAPMKSAPPLPLAAQPVMQIERDSWFVVRCVFERPNCGPLLPTVVSDASEPFQMAGFFDPDAPARPIRIALPIDTSPAGLRKFDKNTAFMISDMLCGQINRVKSLGLGDLVRSVLPWPFHKDLDVPDGGPCTEQPNRPDLSLGMICSLSIPIITICALLLLMIIVSLLDIIFKWLPYFIICFPLPKFKGKANLAGA